ncbi:MAG TPA: S8 family serine peptidase, partial [Anaerolineales bacterium]|nr:S8 family serine peptidase [Anaerolineales bacterium]
MHRKLFSVFSLVLVLAVAFSAVAPVAAQPSAKAKGGDLTESPNGIYIVQMLDKPVVAYDGGINGLRPTKPGNGQKINPLSNDVVRYVAYLNGRHNGALNSVGGEKVYSYYYSYNGFAARMSLAQAQKLANVDGVLVVNPDQIYTTDTSSTPSFLGLDAPGGLWSQLGGPAGGKSVAGAGEDIIIGIIDSGIWPESLSFSDRDAEGKLVYQQIPGWHGKCTPGEEFNASLCGQKLIGAQHFNAAWGGDAALEAQRPWEFMSVRDYNGHGTHTASTSGGNYGVATTGPSTAIGSSISGIAPRARIAMYKALWSTQDASTASGNG